MSKSGSFIVLEGIDCVGKSTVYNSVVDKLKTEGYDLFATKLIVFGRASPEFWRCS